MCSSTLSCNDYSNIRRADGLPSVFGDGGPGTNLHLRQSGLCRRYRRNGAISIATGDFNGDAILDLAVVNEADNTVSILLGKLNGTFAPEATCATGPGPLAIVAGDFNGDGNLDLAVTDGNCVRTDSINQPFSSSGSTFSMLLGNGDGSFRPHIDYATGTDPLRWPQPISTETASPIWRSRAPKAAECLFCLGTEMGHFRLRWAMRLPVRNL